RLPPRAHLPHHPQHAVDAEAGAQAHPAAPATRRQSVLGNPPPRRRVASPTHHRSRRPALAPRPYWKGYLKLSLVTCADSLAPATSEREKVRFHTLNSKTGNRVRSRYVDAETGKPIADDDE